MAEKTAGQVVRGNFKKELKKYVDENPLGFSEEAVTKIREDLHVDDE